MNNVLASLLLVGFDNEIESLLPRTSISDASIWGKADGKGSRYLQKESRQSRNPNSPENRERANTRITNQPSPSLGEAPTECHYRGDMEQDSSSC